MVSMHYREDLRDSPESFLLLLPVHERVRLAEEMLNVGVLGWESRNNPYAEGEFVTTAWICVGRTQFSVDSLKDRLDVLFGCIGDENGELISSKPSKDVTLQERILGHDGGTNQCAIPFLVAEGVVDSFQAVEIDKCEQERFCGSVSQVRVMFGQSEEPRPVIEPCQIIDQSEGQLAQLHAMSLHGVAEGAPQESAVNLPFDQVVLGALVQCLRPEGLIVQRGQHYNGCL